MSGDPEAVVVDIWILRAFDIDNKYVRNTGPHAGKARSGGATDSQYTRIENWITNEARVRGLQPRELCAMIWAGCRTHQTSKANTTRYSDILRHKFTNLFTQPYTKHDT
jgi:hypothetical protein